MQVKIKTVDNNGITIKIEDFKMTIQDLINLIKKSPIKFEDFENIPLFSKNELKDIYAKKIYTIIKSFFKNDFFSSLSKEFSYIFGISFKTILS